ncbi:MAG: adenylate/guanylate cyclase domain-containing protein, partial [Candidatus Limnocylindria bacterium]
MREDSRYGESNEDWRQILMGTHPSLVRQRQIFRHLPSDPRCKVCLAPYAGLGGPLVKAFGFGRYPRNPQICNSCYRQSMAHPGGAVLEISALFADVRGSTGLAEQVGPAEFQRQVEGYYRVATRAVRESGGIVDRLLGDGVMALFIPAFVVGGAHAAAAVHAARSILRGTSLPVGAG